MLPGCITSCCQGPVPWFRFFYALNDALRDRSRAAVILWKSAPPKALRVWVSSLDRTAKAYRHR